MERSHPNWVAERAKCEMGSLFADLQELVKQNVEWANQSQGSSVYEYRDVTSDTCFIRKKVYDRDTRLIACTFRLFPTGRAVEVSAGTSVTNEPEQRLYTIRTHWDAEKSKCRVIVEKTNGGKIIVPHKHLWKVVQYILEPFFFETPEEC